MSPSKSIEPLFHALQSEAARGIEGIDAAAYRKANRDTTHPVLLGSDSLAARVGFFGRDPGRTEVEFAEPFVGKGGQLIRNGLYRAMHGTNCPDFPASLEVGKRVFWGNTVPYKPLGNKAWSVAVKRRFAKTIRILLTQHWQGHDLITCGNVAFDWFRIADSTLAKELKTFWARSDRYASSLEICLDGKPIRLHPLPHPAPLNAVWYTKFPTLLNERLLQLDWRGN